MDLDGCLGCDMMVSDKRCIEMLVLLHATDCDMVVLINLGRRRRLMVSRLEQREHDVGSHRGRRGRAGLSAKPRLDIRSLESGRNGRN